MTRKRILSLTSRKKRNTMLTYSNSTSAGAQGTVAQQPLTVAGGTTDSAILAWVMFRPTAMDLFDPSQTPGSIINTAQRTATTCYMRGLSENIRIETSSGNPWFHRRICFCAKNPVFYAASASDPSGTERSAIASGALETSSGWVRLAANMQLDTLTNTLAAQRNIIFKGEQGIDWDDAITAPLDTTRIDVKYDRTRVYKSGNERGILREIKMFHPMNKNVVYDDDERGAGTRSLDISVDDKRGMGNYHVLDLFSQGSSAAAADRLRVRYTSSMYWHEK